MSIPERWTKFRPLPADIKQRLAQLVPLFEREGVVLAYLFGSLSQGQSGQDVDLALLRPDAPVFRLRQSISECLETERLDLIDLKRTSPVLRFEIISTGRLLYSTTPDVCNEFELDTIRLYQDTAWLRRQQAVYLRERMKHET